MPRLPALGLVAALLSAPVLTPAPGQAQDSRLLSSRPPVLVDGTGQVVGQAFLDQGLSPVPAVLVWLRTGGRDLLLSATTDTLSPGPFPLGRVAFAEPGCTGPPWFVPLSTTSLVFVPVAAGPGNNVLFAPGGPAQGVVINSVWIPSATDPCQLEGGAPLLLQPALPIVNLDSFPPPYTVR